jgi:hypothetical protein
LGASGHDDNAIRNLHRGGLQSVEHSGIRAEGASERKQLGY